MRRDSSGFYVPAPLPRNKMLMVQGGVRLTVFLSKGCRNGRRLAPCKNYFTATADLHFIAFPDKRFTYVSCMSFVQRMHVKNPLRSLLCSDQIISGGIQPAGHYTQGQRSKCSLLSIGLHIVDSWIYRWCHPPRHTRATDMRNRVSTWKCI